MLTMQKVVRGRSVSHSSVLRREHRVKRRCWRRGGGEDRARAGGQWEECRISSIVDYDKKREKCFSNIQNFLN